jgi:cyclic beta-1,2-glucan synthetase
LISSILHALGRHPITTPWDAEGTIREELFGIERLEEHAESLAAAQQITAKSMFRRSLAARLKDNEAVLLKAYRVIGGAAGEGRVATPAAEWLIDNYHLVEDQIGEIRDDLPPGYYRQLPKLADGPFAGYPRVFGIAWAFVAHTDSLFDPDMLCRFVRAYQRVQPLTIGELWAVAITLRIVLVENLRRVAQRIVSSRVARQEADALADRVLGLNDQPAEPVALALQRYGQAALSDAFVVQLVHRLRDQDPHIVPALTWLEERLTAQGTTADEIVRDQHQRQGGNNVTTRNIITSMRLVSGVDWTELVERVSLVDDVLQSGSGFASMDFPTRNLYRRAIEELARGSKLTELEIAQAALHAAADPEEGTDREDDSVDNRARDPGYYLIAGGRRAFERTIAYRAPLRLWLSRRRTRIGLDGYAGGIAIVAAVLLAPLLIALGTSEPRIGGWLLCLLALFGVIPAIDAAVAITNRILSSGFGPRILPTASRLICGRSS